MSSHHTCFVGEQKRVKTRDEALQRGFGKVLRQLRLANGLSQEALAEKSRMHRNHVSFLERGLECPSLAKVFDLAEALQIAPDELIAQVAAEAVKSYPQTRSE